MWNAFTLVGALAGNALGDPRRWGLDGAAVAAFVGLLWPRLKTREPVAIAVVCALVTAVCLPFLPSGIPILIAAAVAAALALITQKKTTERTPLQGQEPSSAGQSTGEEN